MAEVPWIQGAVRAYLLADAPFAASIESRCGTRLPSDMSKPFVQIRVISNVALQRFALSPLVQIDPWVPKDWPEDPELAAHKIAVNAGRLLDVARNITYQGMTWKGEWVSGPIQPHVDTSRGEASPLYGAPIYVELKTHTR